MIGSRSRVRTGIARGNGADLAADLGDLFRDIAKALLDPYRPELHYMRGPGPKWRAKHAPTHAPAPARASRAMRPAVIRLPVGVERDR